MTYKLVLNRIESRKAFYCQYNNIPNTDSNFEKP